MAKSPQGSDWADLGAGTAKPDVPGNPSAGATRPSMRPAGRPSTRAAPRTSPRSPTPSTSPPPAACGARCSASCRTGSCRGAVSKLNYDVLSTIAYFSVGVDRHRQPQEEGLRRHEHHRLGRLDELEHDVGDLQRAPARDAGGAHGQRVRLDARARRTSSAPSSAARRRATRLARQVVAAVRDRGADGVNLDFEPLASGLRGRVRLVPADHAHRAQQGPQGLPADVRHDGLHRELPARGVRGEGRGRRDLRHGLRLPDRRRRRRPAPSTRSPARRTTSPTRVRSYTARVSPSRIILGLPWYGRAWSTARQRRPGDEHERGEVRLQHGRELRERRRPRRPVRAPLGPGRSRARTSPTGARTARGLRLRDELAAGLLRRRAVAEAALRAGQRLRPARRRHVGARLRRRPLRAVPRRRPSRSSSTSPRRRPASGSSRRRAGRRGLRRLVGGARHEHRRLVRRPGLDQRRRLEAVAHRDAGDLRRLARRGRARVRVPRPRGRQQAQRRAPGTSAPPRTRRRRSPPGGFGRVVKDGLAYRAGPDTSSARLGTLPAGTIVAITRGPVSRDGYAWYEVTEPIREWSPVSFVERGVWIAREVVDRRPTSRPYRAPNSTTVDAGIVGFDFGAGPATAVGTGAAQLARAFSPERRPLRRTRSGSAGRTPSPSTRLTLRVYRTNGTLVGSTSVPGPAGRRRRPGTGTAWSTARPSKNGRYVLQLVGPAGGRTFRAPSARPVDRRPGRRVRRHGRHRAPRRDVGLEPAAAALAQRRRRSATASASRSRRPAPRAGRS